MLTKENLIHTVTKITVLKANDFFSRNVKSSIDAINRFENRKTKNGKIDDWQMEVI